MNWLDRAIGAVAPGAGLRRARQRQMIGVLARAYEGARLGRRTEGWIAAGTGANAEIAPAIARLRDRSRDLVRNNPYAAKAVRRAGQQHGRHRAAAAGPGRRRRSWPKQADRLWSEFAASRRCRRPHRLLRAAGADRPQPGRERRGAGAAARAPGRGRAAGAAAAAGARGRPSRQRARPRSCATAASSCRASSSTASAGAAPTGSIPTHPGDGRGGRWSRIGCRRPHVLHLFERLRPGQVRGVPWFAPVMLKLRDLDAYDEAELVRKKIEACFAAFVTGVQDEETLGKARTEADGSRIETFEPGMIEYLEPGRDVKFASPSASGGYAEYMRLQLHADRRRGRAHLRAADRRPQPGELLLDPGRADRVPPPDGGAAVAAAGPRPLPAGLAALRPRRAGRGQAARRRRSPPTGPRRASRRSIR